MVLAVSKRATLTHSLSRSRCEREDEYGSERTADRPPSCWIRDLTVPSRTSTVSLDTSLQRRLGSEDGRECDLNGIVLLVVDMTVTNLLQTPS